MEWHEKCRMLIAAAAVGFTGLMACAGELSDLFQRVTQLESLGLTASVQFRPIQPEHAESCCPLQVQAGEVIEGSFSYMADGIMWRMDSFLDPAQYPQMNTTILYNGAHFAYQANNAGVLSIKTGAPPSVWGMMLMNPAFEIIQFLLPLNDDNEGRQPQLVEAKAAAAAALTGSVHWETVTFEGKSFERAEFPGAVYHDVAYTHRLYTLPGQRDRPRVIDRVDTEGRVITRTRFSGYEDVIVPSGAPWAWPKSVLWQAFHPGDSSLVLEVAMTLDWIVFNQPEAFAAGVFDPEAMAPVGAVFIDGALQP